MTVRQLLVEQSRVHPSWRHILLDALAEVDSDYLESLGNSDDWLPGVHNLFGAFRNDLKTLKYILVGESPYPRAASANGVAFYDAAVNSLWSENGLSKPVNRATSMRNLIKTMLIAENLVIPDQQGRVSQQQIRALDKTALVDNMQTLFENWQQAGFLMLNATPVLHPGRKPTQEARLWGGFLARLLKLLAQPSAIKVTLVVWGKIAQSIESVEAARQYQKIVCEHPYNISFMQNPQMLELFAELKLLRYRN